MKKPTAVIFDMDGVIIDSEPTWREVEVELFNQIGIPLTEDMCRETTGLRIDEVLVYWQQRFPDVSYQHEEFRNKILSRMAYEIRENGEPLPGVVDIFDFLKSAGVRLGLATSSPPILIDAVRERLNLDQWFEVYHSAVDEERGKPDPAVYLSTLKLMEIDCGAVFAIEDSLNGCRAAISAGMKVCAVPEQGAELAGFKQAGAVVYKSLDELRGALTSLWSNI